MKFEEEKIDIKKVEKFNRMGIRSILTESYLHQFAWNPLPTLEPSARKTTNATFWLVFLSKLL